MKSYGTSEQAPLPIQQGRPINDILRNWRSHAIFALGFTTIIVVIISASRTDLDSSALNRSARPNSEQGVVNLPSASLDELNMPHQPLEFHLKHFEAFKTKYGKIYKSASDEAHRFSIFVQNMDKAGLRNKNEHSKYLTHLSRVAVHGVTKFMDLTDTEFQFSILNTHLTSTNRMSLSSLKIASKVCCL